MLKDRDKKANQVLLDVVLSMIIIVFVSGHVKECRETLPVALKK
jgi:hypothetical protein